MNNLTVYEGYTKCQWCGISAISSPPGLTKYNFEEFKLCFMVQVGTFSTSVEKSSVRTLVKIRKLLDQMKHEKYEKMTNFLEIKILHA